MCIRDSVMVICALALVGLGTVNPLSGLCFGIAAVLALTVIFGTE